MRSSRAFRAGTLTLALALSFLTTACATGDETTATPPTNPSASQPDDDARELSEEVSDDNEGEGERIFNASDDVVITAIEQTLSGQNAKARWDGSDLRVDLDGSVSDITAAFPCLALMALLKDGEDAVLSYGDGEIRCSER